MTTDAGQADGAALAVSDAPEADEALTAQEQEFEEQNDDDDGTGEQQAESSEDDDIEDDLDGVKVRGKKEAIERIRAERLMQADYTKKTQAIAEERNFIKVQREIGEQLIDEQAALRNITAQIEAYKNVDWRRAYQDDPEAAGAARMEYDLLREAEQQARNAIQNKAGQLQNVIAEREFKAAQEFTQRLAAEIPNWNNDANIKITNYLRDEGWSDDDIINLRDIRVVRLAAKALGLSAPKSPPKTQPKPQSQPPAKVPSGSTAKTIVGLSDDLPADEWLRRREQQLKRKR